MILEYRCPQCQEINEVFLREQDARPNEHPCPTCGTAMKRLFSTATIFMGEKTAFQRKVRRNREAARVRGEWGANLENPDFDDKLDPHA